MRQRRGYIGALAAAVAFLFSAGLLGLATPFVFMLLSGCFSFHDSCADGAGWAVLISAPISIPLIAIAAVGCAIVAYLRVTRLAKSN